MLIYPRRTVSTGGTLTTSGGLITDAVRNTGTEGDGLTPPAGVGIWPAATNLVTNGGFETDTTGYVAAGAGASIARSTTRAKFGSASLRLQGTTGTCANRYAFTYSAATAYTASMFVYLVSAGGASASQLTVFDGASSFNANINTSLLNQWQRVTLSFTSSAGAGVGNLDAGRFTSVTGGLDCYIDGVQIETGSIATPYIETDGGTASRTAGRVQLPVSGLFTETQGWVVARCGMAWGVSSEPGGFPVVWDWRDDANNNIQIVYFTSDNTFNAYRASGGSSSNAAVTTTHEAGDSITLVQAWNATQVRISEDGAAFVNAANTLIPTLSATSATPGSAGTGNQISSRILWFATGSGTLTDADATALDAFGDTPPTWRELIGALNTTASVTSLWTAVDGNFLKAGSSQRAFLRDVSSPLITPIGS